MIEVHERETSLGSEEVVVKVERIMYIRVEMAGFDDTLHLGLKTARASRIAFCVF